VNNWKETTLGEAVDKIIDNRGKTPPFNLEKGYKLIETWQISIDNKYPSIYRNKQKYVNELTYNQWFRSGHPQKRDILFSTVGESVPQFCFAPEEEKVCIAQNLIGIRPNKEIVDPAFLLFLFKTREFIQSVKNRLIITAQPSIKIPHLLGVVIYLPPLPEQKAIAAILSGFDDKIELLRRQNKTLEQIARTIFKEWFINFNFPGATGKMIDSELGDLPAKASAQAGIPEGWRVGKIKDLIDILSGFAFSSSDFSQDGKYKLVTIKNVQDRHFDSETKDKLTKLPEKMPDYCKLDSGDVLLSLTGNVGRICLVNGEDYLLNQRVAKLRAKNPIDYAFSYLLFLQDSIFSLLQSTASGTAQQNLSPIQTKEIEIIIADRKTLDQFGVVANELIQKINDNNTQIQTLSKLRDTLLPKLMKGKIKVKT
jgi:type I restriction enzyme S subunit